MKDETLLSDEVIESLEMLTSRNYFREWIKNPTGYVAGSIAVRDLVNVVLFADACRAALQSGNSAQPVTVPAGYVLVPVEPTITILDEIDAIFDFGAEDSKDAWHRLLAAAPAMPDSQLTPEQGWTDNSDANAALVMLDRIDTLDPADDDRIEEVKLIIRSLAAPKIPDAPKANNVIGHYQGVDGKEQDIITLAAKKGV